MNTEKFPTMVLYHDDSGDGFGSAWAIYKACTTQFPEFVPVQYGHETPDVAGQHVCLVDFSYKAEQMRKMALHAQSVTIIDHHETAKAELQELIDDSTICGVIDDSCERSAVGITWDRFHPSSPLPRLLAYVQDYDLWRFDLHQTKEVMLYLRSQPSSFSWWDSLSSMFDTAPPGELPLKIALGGGALLRNQQTQIEKASKQAQTMKIAGTNVPVVFTHSNISQLGNTLSKNRPFAACVFLAVDRVVFSLRSQKDGEDVGRIARQNGGGGHRNAAGFSLSIAEYARWIRSQKNSDHLLSPEVDL